MIPVDDDFNSELIEGGIRYTLPRRDLGNFRYAGCVLVAFGLFAVGFMVVWMAMPIRAGLEQLAKQDNFGAALIGFGLLGLFGLIPALGFLLAGLTVLANRTRSIVEVRDGKLYYKEPLLFFTWRRKRPVSEIKRLRVTSATMRHRESAALSNTFGKHACALSAERSIGRSFVLAPGYPREMLLRLANELAPRIEAELAHADPFDDGFGSAADEIDQRSPIEVVDDDPQANGKRPVPQQPAGSVAKIERLEHAMTIHIPPVGIRKGSKGLIYFSLFWSALVSVFVVVAILAVFGEIQVEGDLTPVGMLLFLIPFVLVGVFTMLASINMGRRQASLAVAGGRLFIVRESIFGKKQREWSVAEIRKLCVGPSGMEVNNVPVYELQIHPHEGKKVGLLSQLDNEELEWIAGELNQALDIPMRKEL